MKNFADSRGDIVRTEDLRTNLEHRVTYDSTGRLISKDTLNLATASHTTDRWLRSMEYDYDLNNNLTRLAYADTNGSNVTTYTYGEDNLPQTATLSNNKVLTYSYDKLGRLISSSLPITSSNTLTSAYTYATSVGRSGYTTNKLATEETPAFGYKYNYDALGNIIGIYEGVMNADEEYEYSTTPDIGYVYDSNNQLTTVNDYANNEQYQYEYNSAGNITRRYHYSMNSSWLPSATLESISYAYADTNGWKDLLTKYNGQTITYDAIGNPLSYRDGITMTWQNGRELTTFSNDSYDITFSYDASGMRTKKSIEGVGDTEYVYENGLLLQMQYLYYIFDFSYGADGRAVGFSVTNTDDMSKSFFYYALNSRGDVIALYNSAGTKICTYSYDAYGKLLNTALLSTTSSDRIAANFNPLRYRSYVYDRETGFYYLQTRYYDPTTCRFVNEDNNFSNINLFMYCGNNPIVYFDPTGESYAKDCPGGFGGFSPCFSGGYGSGGGGGGVASTPVTVQYLRVVRPALTVAALSSLTFFVGTTFVLSDVEAMRQEKIERKKDHTVYKLVDSDGYPQYVGRTTDVDARKNAHKRDPNRSHLNFEVIAPNLNYFEARGLEQIAMMECHTLNTANRMNNQINGISPFNKRLGIYMEAGRGVAHYLGNNISNEILYWTGN